MKSSRDKAILNDLQRFRVMTRDQLAQLHFSNVKNPVPACNSVLKRLSRDNLIKPNKAWSPYIYSLSECKIKKDSQKIPHFLEIVDCYMAIKQIREPRNVVVEPKYGKGNIEPDLFLTIGMKPLYIEVQRTQYSEKVMQQKIDRYEEFFDSGIWINEPWQKDEPTFPDIIIVTPTRYAIQTEGRFKVYQTPSIEEFVKRLKPK